MLRKEIRTPNEDMLEQAFQIVMLKGHFDQPFTVADKLNGIISELIEYWKSDIRIDSGGYEAQNFTDTQECELIDAYTRIVNLAKFMGIEVGVEYRKPSITHRSIVKHSFVSTNIYRLSSVPESDINDRGEVFVRTLNEVVQDIYNWFYYYQIDMDDIFVRKLQINARRKYLHK